MFRETRYVINALKAELTLLMPRKKVTTADVAAALGISYNALITRSRRNTPIDRETITFCLKHELDPISILTYKEKP